MKKALYLIITLIASCQGAAMAQADNPNHSKIPETNIYTAAYVKALYAEYPTVKSNFCPACKLWVNPFYKSIADTEKHMPLVTYQYLSKANYANVAKLKVPRSGIFGAWHPVAGQPNEDKVYAAANKLVKPQGDEIAKGHCNAWILNAFSYDSAILSDTYTFNAACESQGQNVGTEIATENYTRKLLATTDVEVWCGTYGSQGSFTDGTIKAAFPAFYWKIIKFGKTTVCYWMSNNKTESQAMLPKRVISYTELVKNLGFDPEKIFHL